LLERTCTLRQDISSFAISLIEKRVQQGTWFLSVVTPHALNHTTGILQNFMDTTVLMDRQTTIAQ
jgi:hypothetical protein